MAITYTGTGGLFTRLGKLVKYIHAWIAYQGTTLMGSGSGADEILDQFNDRRDLVGGVQGNFEGFASAMEGWESQLKRVADGVLADLQSELNSPSAAPATILPLLAQRMIADGQTLDASTVSASLSSTATTNVGNGVLLLSVLGPDGQPDQRIFSETLTVRCSDDRFGGASAGQERLRITGFPAQRVTSYRTQGSGSYEGLTVSAGANLLANGDFETFTTANTPDNWTLGTGAVAGSTVLAESTLLHAATSTAALRLASNATTSAMTVSQSLSDAVHVYRRYAAGVWLRKNGTVNAGSTLQIAIKGTGFTTVNLFNADPSTLTTAYALHSAWFGTAEQIPSDLRMEIAWTNATASGATGQVLIDDAAVVAGVSFSYVYYAIFRGSVDLVVGDEWTVTTTNDEAGVFQSFFGRFYDAQLPSVTNGSETIADSLAT